MQSKTKEVVTTKSRISVLNYLMDKEEKATSNDFISSPVYVYTIHKNLYSVQRLKAQILHCPAIDTGFPIAGCCVGMRRKMDFDWPAPCYIAGQRKCKSHYLILVLFFVNLVILKLCHLIETRQ